MLALLDIVCFLLLWRTHDEALDCNLAACSFKTMSTSTSHFLKRSSSELPGSGSIHHASQIKAKRRKISRARTVTQTRSRKSSVKRALGMGTNTQTPESKLPPAIIPFANRDKGFHEHWYVDRDLLDFPHPFRMLLAAKPNGGKTTVILNIILRVACGKHPFEKIVVVHCDPNTTQEYKDVKHDLRSDIPRPDDIDHQLKTLFILEDLNYIGMTKEQRGYLERLVGYASTHKNVSVMVTAQDPFRILPTVRRCMSVFVLWNNHDQDMLRTLSRKTGKSEQLLDSVLTTQCKGPHDSVWIDLTPNSPAPFRKNGYEVLNATTGPAMVNNSQTNFKSTRKDSQDIDSPTKGTENTDLRHARIFPHRNRSYRDHNKDETNNPDGEDNVDDDDDNGDHGSNRQRLCNSNKSRSIINRNHRRYRTS